VKSGTYSLDSIYEARGVNKVRFSDRKFKIGQSFLLQRDEKYENDDWSPQLFISITDFDMERSFFSYSDHSYRFNGST